MRSTPPPAHSMAHSENQRGAAARAAAANQRALAARGAHGSLAGVVAG